MTRTTLAGEARYVELYAPLLVPGVDPRASRLLLSMPLLAQQEDQRLARPLVVLDHEDAMGVLLPCQARSAGHAPSHHAPWARQVRRTVEAHRTSARRRRADRST